MKGVPIRLEVGPKDIENSQCVLVRRDSGEKLAVSFDALADSALKLLDDIHDGMFAKALKNLQENTHVAHSLEEAKAIQQEKGGFVKTMWCGDLDCEMKMKDEAGMSSRCRPYNQEQLDDHCAICGKKAKEMVIWGVAY